MKGINPNFMMFVGLFVALQTNIATGNISLHYVVPLSWEPWCVGWAKAIAAYGVVVAAMLPQFSSAKTGYFVNNQSPGITPAGKLVAMLTVILFSFLFIGQARAGDVAVPATPVKASPWSLGTYPTLNGVIIGIFTEGGGGGVNASVPGVPPASLTTTTASLGLTAGYMYTPKGSNISYSFEGDVCVQNFNGNSAGFAVQGPVCFAERVMVYAPWQKLLAAMPSFPNPFSGISAFSFQNGITPVGNAVAGLGFEARQTDISTAFAGMESGKVWRNNFAMVAMNVQPLSNGTALRGWVKLDFAGGAKIFGKVPTGLTETTIGTGVRAGLGVAL